MNASFTPSRGAFAPLDAWDLAGFARQGAAVIGPAALASGLHDALVREARTQSREASWALTGERAAGEIGQDNRRAFLGPIARSFMESAEVLALLRRVTGLTLKPSWSASCYTVYAGPGQHMGEHCDKSEACRIAMLVYLEAEWPAGADPGPGLMLHVFTGDSSATPLRLRITSRANRVVVLNGARQAHLRPPLAAGERLAMLAACYAAAGDAETGDAMG